jgi:hypothetical protein
MPLLAGLTAAALTGNDIHDIADFAPQVSGRFISRMGHLSRTVRLDEPRARVGASVGRAGANADAGSHSPQRVHRFPTRSATIAGRRSNLEISDASGCALTSPPPRPARSPVGTPDKPTPG